MTVPVLVSRWLPAATLKGWSGDLLPCSIFWAGDGLSSAGGSTWALGCCEQMRTAEK